MCVSGGDSIPADAMGKMREERVEKKKTLPHCKKSYVLSIFHSFVSRRRHFTTSQSDNCPYLFIISYSILCLFTVHLSLILSLTLSTFVFSLTTNIEMKGRGTKYHVVSIPIADMMPILPWVLPLRLPLDKLDTVDSSMSPLLTN